MHENSLFLMTGGGGGGEMFTLKNSCLRLMKHDIYCIKYLRAFMIDRNV